VSTSTLELVPFSRSSNLYPVSMHIPLRSSGGMGRGVELLFEEAFGDSPGRQPAVDRLAEYVLILLLRDVMGRELIQSGTLRGLSDERLSKALMAMHEQPGTALGRGSTRRHCWHVPRPRFAAHFREVVGTTPMAYLTSWRIGIYRRCCEEGNR